MSLAAIVMAGLAGPFFLHDGDRVVFYGDSITEQQKYTTYIEAFVRTRMPGLRVEFSSAGWAGDTAHGTSGWDEAGGTPEERVAKDVTPRKPTVVTVMLGMNDAYYWSFNPEWLAQFRMEYEHILDLVQTGTPQARFFLIGTTPWDDFTRAPSFPAGIKLDGGYNATLVHYADEIGKIAEERKADYVNLNGPVSRALTKAAAKDQKTAQTFIPDSIHPDWPGALIAAKQIVKAWGASTVVSQVELDASAKRTIRADNSEVADFKGLSWRQRDRSLPFPYDPQNEAMALAVQACNLTAELNQETLTIHHLPAQAFELLIDGKPLGTYSRERFEAGVNLSELQTPMHEASMKALDLVRKKNQVQLTLWRQIERPFEGKFEGEKAAKQGLESLIKDIESETRSVTQPAWHEFELRSVSQ